MTLIHFTSCNLAISKAFKTYNGITETDLKALTLEISTQDLEINCGEKCLQLGTCEGFVFSLNRCTLLSAGIRYISPNPESSSISYRRSEKCTKILGPLDAGNAFDWSDAYYQSRTPINKIRIFYYETFMSTVELTYGSGTVVKYGSTYDGVADGECDLEPGEFVMEIHRETLYYLDFFPVFGAIKFETNKKTCGWYGQPSVEAPKESVKGNKLLYLAGGAGSYYDRIEFYFESC